MSVTSCQVSNEYAECSSRSRFHKVCTISTMVNIFQLKLQIGITLETDPPAPVFLQNMQYLMVKVW